MLTKSPLLILLFFTFSFLNAQDLVSFGPEPSNHECGSHATPQQIDLMDSWRDDILRYEIPQHRTLNSVPITAHIIRRTDGTGGLTVNQLEEAIDIVNQYYFNANLEFYICGEINYIDSDTYFSFNQSEESAMASVNDVDNTINIYFANSVTSSSGSSLCGYAYYPGSWDRILMSVGCTLNGSTLSHEIGHYFGLYHTHGKSNTQLTDELVDGSNCIFAGDDICDTPADPQLGFGNVNVICFYTGNTTDANDDEFVPDPKNIMSYSRKECRDFLSDGQYQRIAYTHQFQRSYLECASLTARFSADTVFATCGDSLVVNFSFEGFNALGWEWDVDGDDTVDYTVENPTHVYKNGGYFNVGLKVNDGVDTIGLEKEEYIFIQPMVKDSFAEDFEEETVKWHILNPDDETTWRRATFNGCADTVSGFIDNYNYFAYDEKDYYVSPIIDLANVENAELKFKVAYAPYGEDYSDTLQIEITSECWDTSEIVFEKGGLTLGTAGDYVSEAWIPDSCSNWRWETIYLNDYTGDSIIFQFVNINGFGNYLFIDSVSVSGDLIAPLPIELLSFSGKAIPNGNNQLTWITTSEFNNDYFIVEQSIDGSTFEEIGRVVGAGTSSIENNYDFIHENPEPGINYYRLKQTDFNGGFEYSNIISIETRINSDFKVIPNPAKDQIFVYFDKDQKFKTQYFIINSLGAIVMEGNSEKEMLDLNIETLSTGFYFLHVRNGNRNWVEKVIVL